MRVPILEDLIDILFDGLRYLRYYNSTWKTEYMNMALGPNMMARMYMFFVLCISISFGISAGIWAVYHVQECYCWFW